MTERLDRIEAAIQRNAEHISALAVSSQSTDQRIERNAEDISTLMGAFESTSDRMSQMLVILQQDISDRREERVVIRQSIVENRQKISENESRFETLLAEARADRQRADADRAEWQRQMAEQAERMERQQAAQLDRMERQQSEWQRQVAAQNRVIQDVLTRLLNHDERIDRLEAS